MGEIKLSREFEAIIQRHIESGDYASPADVVAAGLSLLDALGSGRTDSREGIAAEINAAFDDGSEDIPLDKAFDHIEQIYLQDMKART